MQDVMPWNDHAMNEYDMKSYSQLDINILNELVMLIF